jgi:putative protease
MEYEILAPAGNLDCAWAAINSGANAIYLGLSSFSARAGAENFEEDKLLELIKRAHFLNVKIYVAMNTLVKDSEREDFIRTLLNAWSLGVDAVILQDIFLGKAIKERYSEIVLHLSTQAGVCNEYGARLAKEYGFSRVILARETPFSEIEKITKIIETECFVQGALCTCFSGQCYFSSFAG